MTQSMLGPSQYRGRQVQDHAPVKGSRKLACMHLRIGTGHKQGHHFIGLVNENCIPTGSSCFSSGQM